VKTVERDARPGRILFRKLQNEELLNLFVSSSIIRMIKPARMRWAGRVERIGRRGMHIGFRLESQKERDHYEDLDVGGKTIIKWILEK
jgi:hypothetical protein